MNPITKINTHYNAVKKAVGAAIREKKNVISKKEAISLGEKIYENPDREKIVSELAIPCIRWHGTHRPFVAAQIDKGRFENQGKDIYFSNEMLIAQFFGKAKSNQEAYKSNEISDPVTLKIASNAEIGINAYKQPYFPRQSENPVHILEAYQPREIDEEIPSTMATALSMYQTARDTYYHEIKHKE